MNLNLVDANPEEIFTGYHYTSEKNWKSIKKEGLIPYLLNQQDMWEEFVETPLHGIWLWERLQSGKSHFGNIIWQVHTKETLDIVLMEVTCKVGDLLFHDSGRGIQTIHTGQIGNLTYHIDEPGRVCLKSIPPENIKLLDTYNLEDMVDIRG